MIDRPDRDPEADDRDVAGPLDRLAEEGHQQGHDDDLGQVVLEVVERLDLQPPPAAARRDGRTAGTARPRSTNRTVPIRKMSMIATVSAMRPLLAADDTSPARMSSAMTAHTRDGARTPGAWPTRGTSPSTARMMRNRLVPRMSRIIVDDGTGPSTALASPLRCGRRDTDRLLRIALFGCHRPAADRRRNVASPSVQVTTSPSIAGRPPRPSAQPTTRSCGHAQTDRRAVMPGSVAIGLSARPGDGTRRRQRPDPASSSATGTQPGCRQRLPSARRERPRDQGSASRHGAWPAPVASRAAPTWPCRARPGVRPSGPRHHLRDRQRHPVRWDRSRGTYPRSADRWPRLSRSSRTGRRSRRS